MNQLIFPIKAVTDSVKNIIIVGDSFCSSATAWPQHLADQLNLNLICHGDGGQPWWNARDFLIKQSESNISNADYIIFVHTNAERIPTSNLDIGLIDHSNLGNSGLEQAVKLYFKYIHDPQFLIWAQQQWFHEINRRWGHKKICHLYSFPWTVADNPGLNVITNLCSISLNELGVEKFELFNDNRANHLNNNNNKELANQLAKLLINYQPGSVSLDVNQFELKSTHWFNWH